MRFKASLLRSTNLANLSKLSELAFEARKAD